VMPQTFKTLPVDEVLATPLSQTVTLDRGMTLERVIPHLFLQGDPTGTVTIEVIKDAQSVASKSLDLEYIASEAGKTQVRYHGFVSFVFDAPINLSEGSYQIQLTTSDYTFHENNWFGWVRQPLPDQTSILRYPLDLKLAEIRRR